jgi:hypothetical protein
MKIQFENYFMDPEDIRFNLTKKVVRTKENTGEKYDAEISLGYAMTFEHCINVIAHDKLASDDKTVSITEWIKEYRSVVNIIINTLKQ